MLETMLRHPLAAVLIGFLLTGVFGTTLSNHLADRRQREAEATRLRDTRRDAVRGMSRLLSERLMRMQMLMTAIERHSSSEVVKELERIHEETEAKWALERPGIFLLAREVLGASDYDAFRTDVETRLARKRVLPLRECLDRAYTAVAAGSDGAAVLKDGNAAQVLQECQAGSEAVVDGLYDLAAIAQLTPSDPQAVMIRERVRKQIEQACP